MRKVVRFFVLAVLVMTSASGFVRAQQASVDLPDSAQAGCPGAVNVPSAVPGGGGKLGTKLRVSNNAGVALPSVQVPPPKVVLAACQTGNNASVSAANDICNEALAQGYACTNLLGGGDPCCAAVTDPVPGSGGVTWALRKAVGATTCGFRISKGIGTTSVSIQTDTFGGATCSPTALSVSTNSGNELGTDLLPQYLVQVNPNGVPGVVTFKVFHTQGGANPRTFTVNTSSFINNLQGLHDAIKAGFDGTGLGLSSSSDPRMLPYAQFPETFNGGPVVRIANAATVTKFAVVGVSGQIITQESSVPNAVVPALSPLGAALLVGLLLLTGLWMMRRRGGLSEGRS